MARRRSTKRTSKRRPSSQGNKKFQSALTRLRKLKPSHQSQAMSMANDGFVRKMCTHVKKLRYRKLSGNKSKALKRHAKSLRSLTNKRTSVAVKRRILSQRGGFLPLLLPMLGRIVGPLLAGLAGSSSL